MQARFKPVADLKHKAAPTFYNLQVDAPIRKLLVAKYYK
jgi:hypothetical protein